MASMPPTTKISGVRVKGQPLSGSFPVERIEGGFVFVRHTEHGILRIPQAHTDVPGAAPVTLSYDELVKEINARFAVLSALMDGIVSGTVRSVIVSGAAGVGKTHTVDTKLAAGHANGKVTKITVIKGTVSPIGLYTELWNNREPGQVIVLDDSDEIFSDPVGANLIKAATDSGSRRHVSYLKEAASLEANGIPRTFEYRGAIVVATNIDFEREVASQSKRAVHLAAVLDRAMYLDLGLHSQQALIARVEDVCRNSNMLVDKGLTPSQIASLIAWLKDNQANVRKISLRIAMHLANLIMADSVNWRVMAKATLLRASNR